MTSRTLCLAFAFLLTVWPVATATLYGASQSFGVRLTIREAVGVTLMTASEDADIGNERTGSSTTTLAVPATTLAPALVMRVHLAAGESGTAELVGDDTTPQPASDTVTVLLQ